MQLLRLTACLFGIAAFTGMMVNASPVADPDDETCCAYGFTDDVADI